MNMSEHLGSKAKRSSVLRRTIKPKYETFSIFTSLSRLRRVQSLLTRECNATSKVTPSAPDAILCILGIDARYNDAMLEVANFLFFDFFKNNQKEFEECGLSEEIFEDVILVIRYNRVDFYCNPISLRQFLPYIAVWKNLHIHCLKDEEYKEEDEDVTEEFKIKSFIKMVDGCSVIGIPFNSQCHQPKTFDPMAIEKWPIIQAFALEGFAGGGFFTMKFQVVDVSSELHSICHLLDAVALEVLTTEKLGFLEKQWNSMISICDHIRSNSSDVKLTEDAICEPLRSYFEHGNIGTDILKNQDNVLDCLPFVLFGKNTSKQRLKQTVKGTRVSGTDKSNKDPPTHMICQVLSPRGQLRCRRTYFLRSDVTILDPSQFDKLADEGNVDCQKLYNKDVRLLVFVYKACVSAAAVAIDAFAGSSIISQVKSVARDVLLKEFELFNLSDDTLSWLRNNSEIEIHQQNRSIEGSGEVIKSVAITVFDIPSLGYPGRFLGSVSYADSFVTSEINVQYRDDHEGRCGSSAAVTSCLPTFKMWIMDEPSRGNDQELRKRLRENRMTDSSGELLCLGSGVSICPYDGKPNDLLRNGELCIYENVVAFIHDHCTCVVLPVRHLDFICFFNGGALGVNAVLVFGYTDQVKDLLPACVSSPKTKRVVCFLAPKSKAYRTVFSNVLPLWKSHESIKQKLTIWDELPSDLYDLHLQVQEEFVVTSAGRASRNHSADFQIMKSRLPKLDNLISHLMLSSAGNQCLIASEHLDAVLGQEEYDPGAFDDSSQMVLTVIAGSPGSHKERLFETVLNEFSRREEKWRAIRATTDELTDEFSSSEFQKSLEEAWMSWKDVRGEERRRSLRGILVLPGFTDLVDFLQAIEAHRNHAVSKWTSIGAVTVCVDPMDFFMEHLYALPTVLDSCAQGWVNNVVMTNASCSDEVRNEVQCLIRSANSDVVFLLADKGNLARSQDVEILLSENAFMTSSLISARYLSCPRRLHGRYECGKPFPPMNQVLLKFSQPLERQRLLSHLSGLKSNLKIFPFQGNIYYIRGRMFFTDSLKLHDLMFTTLSGHLRLLPSPKELQKENGGRKSCTGSYVLITGCQLEEERLKDWLRECTTQKKSLCTRDSLTPAEIQRLHKEHCLDALPDGWFYNGNQFVCLDGQRSDFHPLMERFLEEHLDKVNGEVLQHNASLADDKHRHFFD